MLHVPNSPDGLCGRKATLNLNTNEDRELSRKSKSCLYIYIYIYNMCVTPVFHSPAHDDTVGRFRFILLASQCAPNPDRLTTKIVSPVLWRGNVKSKVNECKSVGCLPQSSCCHRTSCRLCPFCARGSPCSVSLGYFCVYNRIDRGGLSG